MKDGVYQVITDRVIALLQQGTIPWHQPWHTNHQPPANLISKKAYRGVNVFLLNSMSYTSPHWLTFKQAQELGGNVRKGEKACPVIFWKWLDVEEDGEIRKVPMLRYYSVFNVSQCDGLPPGKIASPEPITREFTPIEDAERIVEAMPQKPEIKLGLSKAFYSPSSDLVGMPNPESFVTGEAYYNVLFHELTHSTGHKNRLARKGVVESNSFGSNEYSREELIAEMGAAFLCGFCGIEQTTIENSAAYIQNWLKALRGDEKLVVLAAAQAQKASDFILNVKFGEDASN